MICVYPADCTDFSANGNGTLTPLSAEVTETLLARSRLLLAGFQQKNFSFPLLRFRKQILLFLGVPVTNHSATTGMRIETSCKS